MEKSHYRSLVAVYAMVTNDRNEILLSRRANTGYRDGSYDMPAGHLEEGETLRQAAVRELKEETGLDADVDAMEFIEIMHRLADDRVYIDVYFRVRTWQGEASIQEPDKCDDLAWFPMNSLPEMMVPHQKQTLLDRATNTTYREIYEQR